MCVGLHLCVRWGFWLWPATTSKVHYARSRIVTLHNGRCKWTANGQADMQGAADVFVVLVVLVALAVPQSKVVFRVHQAHTFVGREDEDGDATPNWKVQQLGLGN